MESDRSELTSKVEYSLDHYDRVVLAIEPPDHRGLTKRFCEYCAKRDGVNRIAVYLAADEAGQINSLPAPDGGSCDSSFCINRISEAEQESLRNLYHLYDFSDKFRLLAEEPYYGSVMNYVKTGVLTETEAFEALLK